MPIGRAFKKVINCSKILSKRGTMLTKLLDSVEKKQGTNRNKLATELFQPGNKNNICNRRMTVLNTIYQEHITELLMNGKNAIPLQNLGIEITKVRLDGDYKTLNIYWISRNDSKKDSQVATILNNAAGEMQHEITTLKYMGKTPRIKFVKDLFALRETEVNKLLSEIHLNNEILSNDSDGVIRIKEENEFPQMRHDIFGLYHSEIMARILEKEKTSLREKMPNLKSFIGREKSDDSKLLPFDKKIFLKLHHQERILAKKNRKRENSDFYENSISVDNDDSEVTSENVNERYYD